MSSTEKLRKSDFLRNPELSGPVITVLGSHIDRLRGHKQEHTAEHLKRDIRTIASKMSPPGQAIVDTAISLASEAHAGQPRRFTDDPYLIHPLRVALLSVDIANALGINVTPQLIAGALLHDAPEDNPKITEERIRKDFQQFDRQTPGISQRIAEDAEALNHNKPERNGRLTSKEYTNKIKTVGGKIVEQKKDPDYPTILYREIAKTADRLDNLLDPLLLPGEESAAHIQRREYIERTRDPQKMIQLLLADEPLLSDLVDLGTRLAQMTLDHPELFMNIYQDSFN